MIIQHPLILVDGSSYLYRAFHALPPLTNSKGFPTGAIYGMVNMLKRLMTDFKPTDMAVVFDPKGKTFRDDLYPAYKATRKETPDELIQQIEPVYQIIRAMGLPLIVIEGVEADDAIATMTHLATQNKMTTVVATSDKDLAQLVSPSVTLINTMTNVSLNEQGVYEKFGVYPNQIIDYLTLVGDTSDNVPGVPQVGPKTAAKWLHAYHSLENIIQHADEITGKAGDNLRATLPQLPLIQSLVTVKQDVALPVELADLIVKPANKQVLANWYKELEFKNWLSALLVEENDQAKHYAGYVTIDSEHLLDDWIHRLNQAEKIAIDTETTSLDYMSAELVGISFALGVGEAAYVPFGHDYLDAPTQLAKTTVLSKLKPILENASIQKVGQNIKYDIEVLDRAGIKLQGIAFDTMLESYVLDSINAHDLDSLALKYLGWRTITFEEVAGKGSKQLTFNHVEINVASRYAAEDADVTWRLHDALWPRLEKESGLTYIFKNIEMPLILILAQMEQRGVLIDPARLKQQEKVMQKRLQALEKKVFELTSQSFNMNSPKQLQTILYEHLKLPILQKTPTGQP